MERTRSAGAGPCGAAQLPTLALLADVASLHLHPTRPRRSWPRLLRASRSSSTWAGRPCARPSPSPWRWWSGAAAACRAPRCFVPHPTGLVGRVDVCDIPSHLLDTVCQLSLPVSCSALVNSRLVLNLGGQIVADVAHLLDAVLHHNGQVLRQGQDDLRRQGGRLCTRAGVESAIV